MAEGVPGNDNGPGSQLIKWTWSTLSLFFSARLVPGSQRRALHTESTVARQHNLVLSSCPFSMTRSYHK